MLFEATQNSLHWIQIFNKNQTILKTWIYFSMDYKLGLFTKPVYFSLSSPSPFLSVILLMRLLIKCSPKQTNKTKTPFLGYSKSGSAVIVSPDFGEVPCCQKMKTESRTQKWRRQQQQLDRLKSETAKWKAGGTVRRKTWVLSALILDPGHVL